MAQLITGLHHITALASDPQKNIDFYTGFLGLRFVKKTINFDAPEIYHFYYGNEEGSPGTILTFFPYPTIPQGQKGLGQLTVSSFSIPEKAIDYWKKRLEQFHITYNGPEKRFDETVLYFEDHDGLGLELVANSQDSRPGFTYGQIPLEFSIRGIYGITLSEECYERTARLLSEQLNHTLIAEKNGRFRYSTHGKPGDFVDILCHPDALHGRGGYGTVHHVAFAAPSDAAQREMRDNLVDIGCNVSPILDREYFHSIYFREPGGVLFEVATVAPGFTADEPLAHLGESLKLPPWQEPHRSTIEKLLTPVQLHISRYTK
jgi:glyoxalase family protein